MKSCDFTNEVIILKNGGFFKSNWAYLIWFAFYFTFAVVVVYAFVQNIGLSLLITALIYGISIAFAVSPIGEALARVLEGAKPIQTQQDKDYLLPIFEEVYGEVLKTTPQLSKDIKIYITESMAVNAFALGSRTIAVTRGALYAFSSEELKGILSHEFGHMVNGDTKALLIKLVGNGFFSLIVFVFRFVALILQTISNALSGKNIVIVVISVVLFLTRLIIDLSILVFVFIGDIIIALNSRYSELLADEYAHIIGYGEDLKSALYVISQLEMPSKLSLTERLKASHPYTSARIERLEQLETQSA